MTEMGMLAEQYIVSRYRKGELSKSSVRNNRSLLSAFTATYGGREIKDLRRFHINKFLETRSGLKQGTRRFQFSMLKGFVNWLVEEHHVRQNPMIGLKAPQSPRRVPRRLQEDPVARLFSVLPDQRAFAIVSLMLWSGLRCAEVSGLLIENWDQGRSTVVVTGKGSHERTVPVPPEAVPFLDAYMVEFPAASGMLIRNFLTPWKGLAPSTISKMVSRWMREAGIKRFPRDGVSAHALRHTAATDVLEACNDLRVVQQMLGHAQLATTSVYLDVADLPRMHEGMKGRTYRRSVNPAAADPDPQPEVEVADPEPEVGE